jgi:hypothetical protein
MVEDSEYVTEAHFEEAMKSIEVNVSERERRLKLMINELKKLENVNHSFLNSALQFWVKSEGSDRVKGVIT